MFYLCGAGGAEQPCNTVIERQLWDRLKDELQASGQRCYCKCCKARYKTKFGVMVEIVIKGQAMYCQAEFPPNNVQDAKLMKMEKDFQELLLHIMYYDSKVWINYWNFTFQIC